MRRKQNKRGFTLIEVTIVIGIFAVIGIIIVGILNSSLRGNTKTKLTSDLAQNGNYALTLISNLLLNSRRFQSIVSYPSFTEYEVCSTTGISGKTISVAAFDGGLSTLSCSDVGATPTYSISSASATFSASIPTPTTFKTTTLIDTSQVRLVADSCYFTCTQADAYSAPRIDIKFQLMSAQSATNEQLGIATFSASVSLRNVDLK